MSVLSSNRTLAHESMRATNGLTGLNGRKSKSRSKREFAEAPLASLDCSITEPITYQNHEEETTIDSNMEACKTTNTTKTATFERNSCHNKQTSGDMPTLSGYFDYDELSDMLDDSLFEITNVGCLSRSVFSRAHVAAQVAVAATAPFELEEKLAHRQVVVGGVPVSSSPFELSEVKETSYKRVDSTSQPIKLMATMITQANSERDGQEEKTTSGPLVVNEFKEQLVELNKYHPAYDYSSTCSIPIRSSSVSVSVSAQQQQHKSQRNNKHTRASEEPAKRSACSIASSMQHSTSTRRKTRSQSDVRGEEVETNRTQFCAKCQVLNGNGVKNEKKKRFSRFSLFNLFAGALNDNNPTINDYDKRIDTCQQCKQQQAIGNNNQQQTAQRNSTQRVSKGRRRKVNSNTNNNDDDYHNDNDHSKSGTIKSRDSIKLTNQRKQRSGKNSTGGVRVSASAQNFQQQPANEILLDLSHQTRGTSGKLDRDKATSQSATLNRISIGKNKTKCVKFTTPDHVMMILPNSLSKASSANLPSSNLQPSAPIIKRQVPRSSSYSQTDSSKNLDELLAKYERNNDLIAEINEKLKLTESIASPKSVLDCEPDDEQQYEDSTRTQLDNRDCFNFHSKNSDHPDEITGSRYQNEPMESSINQGGKLEEEIKSNQADKKENNNIQVDSSLLSEAEEAGFSRDWISKQRALV